MVTQVNILEHKQCFSVRLRLNLLTYATELSEQVWSAIYFDFSIHFGTVNKYRSIKYKSTLNV